MRGRPEVRLAVGREAVTAILPDGEVRTAPLPRGGEGFGELASRAITTLLEGVEPGRIHWTLLPALADARSVRLPPLDEDETTDVLTRHASRYFPSTSGEQAVGWRLIEEPPGSPVELLAAAADATLVSDIRSAIRASGFEPGDPIPAIDAWVGAAVAERSGAEVVVVVAPEQAILIRVEEGRSADVALLPPRALDRLPPRIEGWSSGGRVVVLGNGGVEAALVARLEDGLPDGYELHLGRPEASATVAARFADASGLALVASGLREERAAHLRRRGAQLWVASAILVVAAGLLELWGVHLEAARVEAERQELSAAVSDALIQREAIDRRRTIIGAVDSLERTAPPWVGIVADLGLQLPDDAYLETVHGRPDSLVIDGVASDAAGVFAALRGVSGVRAIQPRAPIRRQVVNGNALERFSLTARVGRRESIDGESPTTSALEGGAAP